MRQVQNRNNDSIHKSGDDESKEEDDDESEDEVDYSQKEDDVKSESDESELEEWVLVVFCNSPIDFISYLFHFSVGQRILRSYNWPGQCNGATQTSILFC